MATFTGTGTSTSLTVGSQHTITFALSGTFVANVALERAVGSSAWEQVSLAGAPITWTAALIPGTYRLRCTDFTSGTVTYSLTSTAQNVVEFRSPSGTVKFSIDSDGGVVGGGSGGGGSTAPITLTDGATITPDSTVLTSGSIGDLTLGGNRTLANVSGLVAGVVWTARIYIRQDATGSRTLAYGVNYTWPAGIAGVLSTAANAVDTLDLSWDGTSLTAVLTKGFA